MKTNNVVKLYKYNKSAEEAIQQIKHRKYYESFLYQGKSIHLLGINLNSAIRNIDQWIEEIIETC